MVLQTVPEQTGGFPGFERYLQRELPPFVRRNQNVHRSLIKYGMVPDGHHQHTRVLSPQERKARLDRALAWGGPPRVIVMGESGRLEGNASSSWLGSHGAGIIRVFRPLVTQWQSNPDDRILRRTLTYVMLHELVHYFNDQLLPGVAIHREKGHLREFGAEALESPPLCWPRAEYAGYPEIMASRGVRRDG